MNSSRRKLWVGLVVIVTVAVAIFIYLRLRPVSMIEHARTIAYARLRGDTDLLFDYMMPEEPPITGITRSSFRDAYNLLIAPRLKRFNQVEREETDLLGIGDQGSCTVYLRSADGIQFNISSAPFFADEGRGAYEQPNLFGKMLKKSWLADYAVERNGRPGTELGKWKIFLRKLDQDMPTLRTLGIKGQMSYKLVGIMFQDLKLRTWESYRRGLVREIKKLEGVLPDPKPVPPASDLPPPNVG